MKELRCILLDDELPALRYLRSICEGFSNVEVVKAFNNPLRMLEEVDQLDFNVCVLDIEMPQMNGMELAGKLEGKAIIFTTAYKEFAAEAYELDAVDYIIKPIQFDRLKKAFDKSYNFLQREELPQYVQLNSNKGKILLHFAMIAFIVVSEVDKRDKRVIYDDRREVTLKNISFEQLVKLLPRDAFVRINRQTIIATRCVHAFTHNQVTLLVGSKSFVFSLNEHYRKDFLAMFGA
ncbi:response regulator transcription factor [Olivibacter sp. LS-1]|uniref:LytR/AlgR family response regulator transcription factor n=1 Tax=Olivibacter sp. LS-1 TaxID=2592345 RepID=UPI0011EB38F2|nr:response regulator [Olivibacter sp. LS-1]QEL02335.1 response regulator transcription factor [Olivibacter sp. LS-1]